VRRDLAAAIRLLVLPTLALAVVVAFLPGRLSLAIRLYGLVLCAVALGLALAALRRTYPRAAPLRRPVTRTVPRRTPPPSLARLEHETAIGVAGSFDLHHRLRPRLRLLAQGVLATRRRVSLDGEPEAARRAIGEETWELVRSDRPPPEDRLARGLSVSELGRVVESLEGV